MKLLPVFLSLSRAQNNTEVEVAVSAQEEVSSSEALLVPEEEPIIVEDPAEWSSWDDCSKQCGGGIRVRTKEPCDTEECINETEECNSQECSWLPWVESECSKSCGGGTAQKNRVCPEENQCIGSSSETVRCNEKDCPQVQLSYWTEWSEPTPCSASCFPGGKRRRERQCIGDGCPGSRVKVWSCNAKFQCKDDQPGWTEWGNWSDCQGSCHTGRRARYRTCQKGWKKCDGNSKESGTCTPKACSENSWGNWQNWSQWSSCSKTCGGGTIRRTRHCNRGSQHACRTKIGSESMKEAEQRWCKIKDCPQTTHKPKPTHHWHQKPATTPAKLKASVAGNMLGNGNAEQNAGTWGATNNWFCNNCQATRITSDKHEGNSALKISGRKATWAGINYNLGKKVSDGGSYNLIGWVKVLSSESQKLTVTAKIESGGKPKYMPQVSKVVPGNTWTEINGVIAASGGDVTIYIEGGGKADYLIDNFSLVRMGGGQSAPTPAPKSDLKIPSEDDGKEKLKDPGFEISPNWGIGWGCQGCVGVPVTDDVKFGKRAMKITQRQDTWAGPVQSLKYGAHIMKNAVYTAQVWVKSLGNDENMDTYELTVKVDYRVKKDVWLKFGKLCTTPGEWGLLSGQVQIKDDPHLVNKLEFYVEGPAASREYLVDGASLKVSKVPQSFFDEADDKIDKLRKVNFNVQTNIPEYKNVTISIQQQSHSFPFGSAIDASLFTSNTKYRDFFYDNFNYAVFENKMKWRQIEWSPGQRNFHEVDQAMKLLQNKNIPVRGHTVFWGVEKYVPKWLKSMEPEAQLAKCRSHAEDLVGRFKGKLTHWDVNNEMLHGDYFEKTLGGNIRADMFKWTKEIDPNALTFMNDYEILSGGLTNCYKKQISDLMKAGAPIDGVGVQSHFKDAERNVDPIQVQAKLDTLAELGLPIWVTELDVSQWDANSRANHLAKFLYAAFSHQSVDGIMLWGYWDQRHWRGKEASLADGPNLTLNAAGKKYRDLIFNKWWTSEKVNKEEASVRAFKGDYIVSILDEKQQVIEKKTVSLNDDTLICFGECNDLESITPKMAEPEEELEGSGQGADTSISL